MATRLGTVLSLAASVAIITVGFFWQATINSISAFGIRDPLAPIATTVSNASTNPSLASIPFDSACVSLKQRFPSIIHMPSSQGYAHSYGAYWSSQAQSLLASCVARPRNTTEVANIVGELNNLYRSSRSDDVSPATGTPNNIRFAVKGGGHSGEAGFASIAGGVLIDVTGLNTVAINVDRQSVHIGGGVRWGDVYPKTHDKGLMVAGGRDSHVGAGGLLLGNGVSFFAPEVGMSCDNILEYEIVLANGTIAIASEFRNSDLWRSLKGGSGNFGIVTRFTAKAFPTTKVWGGFVYYVHGQAKNLINALHEFAKPENFDKHAATPVVMLGYVRMMGIGVPVMASQLTYTKPEPWPKVFQGFDTILRFWSTVKVRTVGDLAIESSSLAPLGKRQYHSTFTIRNDQESLHVLYEIYKSLWTKLKHVNGATSCLVYQTISHATIHHAAPNMLGLGSRVPAYESLIIVYLSHAWKLESDDQLVEDAATQLQRDMQDYARTKGVLDPYIYLNYARSDQDVFASYGQASLGFLGDVSRNYDPDGFWQHAKQGGFKLHI